MMAGNLYPPLDTIRDELFGGSAVPEADTELPAENTGTSGEPMPEFIRALIDRKLAAAEAFPPEPPAAGQIRSLNAVVAADGSTTRPLGRNCGFLLGAHIAGRQWSGWLVTQETDYATDRDLVIEHEDGPVAPQAGMVQAWNPVRGCLNGNEAILGKLQPARLAAVMTLAEGSHTPPEVRPRPGHIGAWNLDHALVVLTGTPLGGAGDPRRRYQALYHQLAHEIAAATEAAAPPVPNPTESANWFVRTFVRPVWTFGALAASAMLALTVLLTTSTPTVTELGYRDAPVPGKGTAAQKNGYVLHITVAADTRLSAIQTLLSIPGASLRHLEFRNGNAIVWLHVQADGKQNSDATVSHIQSIPGVQSVKEISE